MQQQLLDREATCSLIQTSRPPLRSVRMLTTRWWRVQLRAYTPPLQLQSEWVQAADLFEDLASYLQETGWQVLPRHKTRTLVRKTLACLRARSLPLTEVLAPSHRAARHASISQPVRTAQQA